MEKPRLVGLKKFCCYSGCSNNSIEHSNFTFFAFPKSEDRRELWCKHAGITQAVGENRAARFLCEAHFANIYICRSPRRTLLLHTAVPYPCDKATESLDEPSDSIDPIVPDDTQEEGNDDMEQIETVAIEEEQLEEEDNMKVVNSSDEEIQIESQIMNVTPLVLARKRKDPIARIAEMKAKLMKACPPISRGEEKRLTIQMRGGPDSSRPRSVSDTVAQVQPQHPTTTVAENQPPTTYNQGLKSAQKSPATSSTKTVQRKKETQTNEKSDDVSLLNRDQISEFIFRGEEYVQMPKAVYERQLEGLKRKVARYENILLTMRDVMEEANLDDSLDS